MATAAAEGRTLIKTDTAGWFIDPANADKKVRKTDGDTIMTREQYDTLMTQPATEPTAAETAEAKRRAHVKAAAAVAPTRLTSGAQATTRTMVIQCAWVDPEHRTEAQQKLFAGPVNKITYDAVKAAAGTVQAAMPDGRERVIKTQDAFQVKFHPENQDKWRNERRRITNANKRKARKAS